MKIQDLFENRDAKIGTMRRVVKTLGPLGKKIEYQRLITSATAIGSIVPVVAGTGMKEIKEIIDALNSNADFKQYWVARLVEYVKNGFAIENIEEIRSREAQEKRSASRKTKAKNFDVKSISKEVATTAFSKKQLEEAAKTTGKILFSKDHSGLIWGGGTRIIKTNSFELLKKTVEEQGDIAELTIATFEFVFFPSGKKTPIDGSDHLNIILDTKKLQDVDGNIYLCDNSGETVIRVVKPVIAPKDYEVVLGSLNIE